MTTISPRVLIVDDEESFASVLHAACEQCSFDVETVHSAEAASVRLRQFPGFDAIVVDKNLPGRSGVELVAWIRASDQQMAVLMLTAYPTPESMKDTLNLGVDAYLEKPLNDIFDAPRTIREAVEKRRQGETRARTVRTILLVSSIAARPLLVAPLEGTGTILSFAEREEDVVRMIEKDRPDLVVVDAPSQRAFFLRLIGRVRRAAPRTAVVVYAPVNLDLTTLRSLIQLGVKGLYDLETYAWAIRVHVLEIAQSPSA